jgi:hypothetical protein
MVQEGVDYPDESDGLFRVVIDTNIVHRLFNPVLVDLKWFTEESAPLIFR